LKGLFAKQALKRDVSRLESAGSDVNVVEEVVDTSGGPLKAGHRRRALRDPRLLPKAKSTFTGHFVRRRRPKVMQAGEADRLFSSSLRTRNRHVRDLVADEEQLGRYGVPIWRNEQEVAQALGLTVQRLRFFSIHRARERTCHYVTFA